MSRESATERGMWDRISRLVGATAPVLGGMLGGPAGASIGGAVANALGVANNPSAIEKALQVDPHAATKLAELETSLEMARIQAERDVTVAQEQTHQAALNQSDLITKRTRPMIARQSWGATIAYAVVTWFSQLADPFVTHDLSALQFDPVVFGTVAGPALWYMGMRGLEKYKHGGSL